MTDEFWAPVHGYEETYEVSSLGRFRRADNHAAVAVTISPWNGYGYVHLSQNGKARNYRAHRIVLSSHIGLPSGAQEACHRDGDRSHNSLSNLYWGTAVENADDKRRHGTLRGALKGELHHNAKLSNADVEAIYDLSESGWRQADIAEFFGVTQSNISKILTGISRQSHEATKRTEARL